MRFFARHFVSFYNLLLPWERFGSASSLMTDIKKRPKGVIRSSRTKTNSATGFCSLGVQFLHVIKSCSFLNTWADPVVHLHPHKCSLGVACYCTNTEQLTTYVKTRIRDLGFEPTTMLFLFYRVLGKSTTRFN